jgi:hypothetical protein
VYLVRIFDNNAQVILSWKTQRKETNFVELGSDERIMQKWILKKYGVTMWTGFNWLKIQACGGILFTWYYTIRFYTMQEIS